MKIWANTVVHNEENFIWFAVMSVVDYVDKVLVWDTGSTDKTRDIIDEIKERKGEKISFKEVGPVNRFQLVEMRRKMLEESDCDWLLILDGDEIWWRNSIHNLVKIIRKENNDINGVVVPMVVPVGDLYHFQDNSAGRYELLGRKGHYNLRAINRNIPGLHVDGKYPLEGYFDSSNCLVQNKDKIVFLDAPYLHATHLKRSSKVRFYSKFKYEMGTPFPTDFRYPEVFYNFLPDIVSNPFQKLSCIDFILANIMTPIRKVKRKLSL